MTHDEMMAKLRRDGAVMTEGVGNRADVEKHIAQVKAEAPEGASVISCGANGEAVFVLAAGGDGPGGSVVMANSQAIDLGLALIRLALKDHLSSCDGPECGINQWLVKGEILKVAMTTDEARQNSADEMPDWNTVN